MDMSHAQIVSIMAVSIGSVILIREVVRHPTLKVSRTGASMSQSGSSPSFCKFRRRPKIDQGLGRCCRHGVNQAEKGQSAKEAEVALPFGDSTICVQRGRRGWFQQPSGGPWLSIMWRYVRSPFEGAQGERRVGQRAW